jgi:peptidyl-prolyl cis-trans isomerase C
MYLSSGRRLAASFGALLVASLLAAAPAAAQEDKVVATVNGQTITEADVALAEEELDPQFSQLAPDQKRAAALSALIEIRLMAAEEEKAGVQDTADSSAAWSSCG